MMNIDYPTLQMPSTAKTVTATPTLSAGAIRSATRYDVIELLRFLAATLVVLVHMPTLRWELGQFGVDVFFVISGFVMMASTDSSAAHFFTKRIIRIVPLYWFFTFIVFAVAMMAPTLLINTRPVPEELLKSLFFIPFNKNGAGHLPVLYLGWTLNYEMYFYAIFAIALMFSHRFRGVIAAGAITALLILCYHLEGFPAVVYSNTIVMEFIMGMLVFELLGRSRYSMQERHVHVLIYITLLALPFVFGTTHDVFRGYGFGTAAFFTVLISVWLLRDVSMPRFVLSLGAASYALYLSHPYILTVFERVFHFYGHGPIIDTISTTLSFALVSGIGILVFRWFERPITRALRERFLGSSANT